MHKYILTLFFCFTFQFCFSQKTAQEGYVLQVHLRNAPFKSLALLDYRDAHNMIIRGSKVAEFKWKFIIPDSLAENSEFMMLIVPEKDTAANAYRQIRFTHSLAQRKTIITNIGVQDKMNFIEAEYREKVLFEKENVSFMLGRPDSVITGNLICDDFELVLKKDSSDITVRTLDPYFAWFEDGNINTTYSKNLESYVSLSKQFPSSRYLITYLALNIPRFKTRKDIKKVYQNFSSKFRQSKWAKRIENYLANDFQNISLQNLTSKKKEPIIPDSSKYNLLIFSASWCVPCIEEIPVLKKLNQDLKQKINFTNICMDNEKGIKGFQSILSKNEVSWRTLYAFPELEKVTDLFSVRSIPLNILIHPDGHMEVLDVRKQSDQQKLYHIK